MKHLQHHQEVDGSTKPPVGTVALHRTLWLFSLLAALAVVLFFVNDQFSNRNQHSCLEEKSAEEISIDASSYACLTLNETSTVPTEECNADNSQKVYTGIAKIQGQDSQINANAPPPVSLQTNESEKLINGKYNTSVDNWSNAGFLLTLPIAELLEKLASLSNDSPALQFGQRYIKEHDNAHWEGLSSQLGISAPPRQVTATETLPAGTLIIAMDDALQDGSSTRVRQAYGLAVHLLHADVPLKWIIDPNKTSRTAVDFSASARRISPTTSGFSNRNFRAGPVAVFPGFETEAQTVINSFGNGIRVYELQNATTVDVHSDLTHKPFVFVEEDQNPDIHTSILSAAGLTEDANGATGGITGHYQEGPLTSVNVNSCVTIITVPHNDAISTSQRNAVKDFTRNGGNFFAQCAGVRGFQANTPRVFTNAGFDDEPGLGTFAYDNPTEPSAQFEGNIVDEGGSLEDFGFSTDPPGGTRIVHGTGSQSDHYKAYTGRIDGFNSASGGYVHYLGGHNHDGDIDADRFYLNAVLRSATRPMGCGLTIATVSAADDAGVVDCGTDFIDINVLSNDQDLTNNPPLTIQNLTNTTPGLGTFAVVSGQVRFTPSFSGTWEGPAIATYEACNNNNLCDQATITITGPSATDNTIGGTVFSDTNQNGNLNGGETGAAGITVNLCESGSTVPVQTTSTIAGGAYEFTVTPPVTCTDGTLFTTADAFTAEEDPNQEFGTCDDLGMTYYNGNFDSYIYSQFDLSGIDPNCTVTSAQLILTHGGNDCWGDGGSSGTINMQARRVTGSWSETTINWNNQPGNTGNFGTDSGNRNNPNGTNYSFDVTSLVQQWLSGTPNHGVVVVPIGTPPDAWFSMLSRESSVANGPRLQITYGPSAGANDYDIKVDASTLPAGATFTTDNIETANFTGVGQLDCNNNFGYIACPVEPEAGNNGSTTICEGTSSLNLRDVITGEDAGGTWTQSTGPSTVPISGNNANFSNANPGTYTFTYTVTATNCPTDMSTATVTVEAALDPGNNGTLTICEGESFTTTDLFNALGGSPDAGGNWSPAPSGAGTYTYTHPATANCPAVSAQVVVTAETPLDAGTNGTLTICEGDIVTTTQLFNALGGSPDPGGVWTPMPSGAGTYTYTHAATTNCPASSAQVVVTEQSILDPGSNGTLVICEGESFTTTDLFNALTGSPDPGGIWSPAPSGAGTYTYTHPAAGSCPQTSAQVVVTAETPLDPGTNGTLVICEGESFTTTDLFNALGGSPDPGGVWTPMPSGAGTYTYTHAATANCPATSAQVVVTEQGVLDPGSNGTLTICEGEAFTTMDLFNALGGSPDPGGIWSPSPGGAGTYTYTHPAVGSCPETSAQVVVTEETPLDPGMNGTLTICEGESFTTTDLFNALGGSPDGGGTWSPAPSGAGTYTYTHAATANCPATSAQVVVTEETPLDPGMNGTLTICEGESFTTTDLFNALGGSPDGGGTWSPAPSGAGTYTYTHAATANCPATSAQVVVTEETPLDPGMNGTLTICEGESFTTTDLFNALGGSPDGGGTWSPAPSGAGTYTYTHAATANCPATSAQVVVTEETPLDPGMNGTLTICEGETNPVNLFSVITGEESGGTWTETSASSSGVMIGLGTAVDFSFVVPGVYEFTYTQAATANCPAGSSTATITVSDQLEAGADNGIELCENNTFPINLVTLLVNADPGGTWAQTGGANVNISNPESVDFTNVGFGTYTFTYTQPASGACASDVAVITVEIAEFNETGVGSSTEICEGDNTPIDLFDLLTGEESGGQFFQTSGPTSFGMFAVGPVLSFGSVMPGTYTFSYSFDFINPPCPGDQASTVTVIVTDQLEAGADNSTEFCEGEGANTNLTVLLIGADAGGMWMQTGGSTTIVITNPSNVNFSSAAPDTYTFTYTHAANGSCLQDQAVITVTVTDQLEAGTDNSDEFCEGSGANYNLTSLLVGADPNGMWAQTSGVSFINLGNPANVNFSNAAPGVYSFTYTHLATGSCSQSQAIITITITEQLEAGDNNSDALCEGEGASYDLTSLLSANADPNGVWVQTSGASFIVVSNPTDVDFSNAAPGTYNFTYNHPVSGSCVQDQATITIVIEDRLEAGTNGTLNICEGETVTEAALFASLGGSPDPGGVWTPAFAGEGTYTYTHAATANCPASSAQVVVTETTGLDPGTNGTLVICQGEIVTEIQLFNALGGTPDAGGNWTPTLAGAGTYTYTHPAIGSCPSSSAQVIVTEETPADAGNNGTSEFCEGESTPQNLFDIITDEDSGGSWSETTMGMSSGVVIGSGTAVDFSGVAPGIYEFTYTIPATAACPAVSATATITVTDQLQAGADNSDEFCEGSGANYSLMTLLSGADPNGDWAQTTGPTVDISNPMNVDFSGAAPGTYIFTYTHPMVGSCMQAQATFTITIIDQLEAGANNSDVFCEGEGANYNLNSLLSGADAGGMWMQANGNMVNISNPANVDFSGADPGMYIFTYTHPVSGSCAQDQATFTITIEDRLDAGMNGALSICEGETVTEMQLFNALGGTPDPGGVWTPTLAGEGTYTYTHAATANCTASSAQVVVTETTGLDAGMNGTLVICEGETVTEMQLFNALEGTPDPGGAWTPMPFAGAGTYTYTHAAVGACPQTSAEVVVTEEVCCPDAPVVSVGEVSCVNGTTYEYTFAASPGAIVESANGTISDNTVTVAVGTNDVLTAYNEVGCDVVTLNVTSPSSCNIMCEQSDLTLGNSVCNGASYSVAFTETTGATITTGPGSYTITGNEISGIPIGTNLTVTATNPNDGDCAVTLTAVSPDDCNDPCPDELISVSALGECAIDGNSYSVYFTLAPGATLTTSPVVGSIGSNVITGIPAGTDISLIATNVNCNLTDDILVTAPDCCPDAPVVSVGEVSCVNGTTYEYTFAASPGAIVESANGNIIGNTVTVAVGTDDVLTAFNAVTCESVSLNVTSPASCNIMCEQPDLTLGNSVCNVSTYSVAYTETTGATITTAPGSYTVSGNVVSGIPIGTDVIITATNPNDGDCAITLTAISPMPEECNTCPEEQISVSGLGECDVDGNSYSVYFTLAPGATLTTDPVVGAIGTNVITGIPAGTDIRLIATNAPCNLEDDIIVTAPDCCPDAPVVSVGEVSCVNGTTYEYTFAASPGAIVESANGNIIGNTVTVAVGTDDVLTAFNAVTCESVSLNVTSPASCNIMCEQPDLTLGNSVCNVSTYSVAYTETTGATITTAPGSYTVSGNVVSGIPIGTDVIITATNPNDGDCAITLTAISPMPEECNTCPEEQISVSGLGECDVDGNSYSVYFTLAPGATLTTDPVVGAIGTNVITGIPAGTDIRLIATNAPCNLEDDIIVTAPDCCPDAPVVSVGEVSCVNGTIYEYTFAASPGAIVESANGNIIGNTVTVAVGTDDVLTAFNAVTCESVSLNVTSPASCNIMCEQPDLTLGNSVCNVSTYSVAYTETTGATITTAPGSYTVSGNVVSGIPIGTDVIITATNPNDGDCAITLTAISPMPEECNTCPEEQISVSGLGECDVDGNSYSVYFTLAPGATLTTDPVVGAIGTNVITGIPAGTDIRLIATNAPCNLEDDIIVTAPDCCPDAPVVSVGEVSCVNGTTYEYTFAASPGAIVESANGNIIGNTVTVAVGTDDVLTAFNAVTCELVILSITSPASCNIMCEQPDLTLGNSVCNGSTYSVTYTETTGATLLTGPGNYTITGNMISGIPIGTDVMITATNPNDGDCAVTLTAVSPDDCDDPCPDELISVSALGECAADGNSYSVYFTLAPGATLTTNPTIGSIGSNVITGIPAGTDISLIATNVNCNLTDDILVTAPNCDCPVVDPPTGDDVSYCAGEAIPSITAMVAGGQTVDWYDAPTGDNLLASATTTFTPGAAGTYYAEAVEISSGCTSVSRTPIVVSEVPVPTVSVVPTDPTDCNISDGRIVITASGTALDLKYSINGGLSFSDNGVFIGLDPGSYDVVVMYGECTEDFGIVTLSGPSNPMVTNVSVNNPDDCDSPTGSITVTSSTPVISTEYSIDGGQTWQASNIFTGLIAGFYEVYVRNSDGTCPTAGPVEVLQEPVDPILLFVTSTDPTGCDGVDGTITAVGGGGEPPYQFQLRGPNGLVLGWTAPVTEFTFTGLSEGKYDIAIRNGNGTCEIDPLIVQLDDIDRPTIVGLTTERSMCLAGGSATFFVDGGETLDSYQYSTDALNWTPAGSSFTFTSLPPGVNTLWVANSNLSCPVSLDVTIGNECLELEKSSQLSDTNMDGFIGAGDDISFSFVVTNTGDVPITSVNITDPQLPILGSFAGTLNPGDSYSGASATYTVTAMDVAAGQYVNQATASGQNPENMMVDDLSDDPDDPTDNDLEGDGEPDDPTVTIIPNGQPLANDDNTSVCEDESTNIAVLVNDDFGSNGPGMGPITITVNPSNGVATVNDNGTANDPTDDSIDYTPNTGFTGTDMLSYEICDADGDCSTADVTVTVEDQLDPGTNGTLTICEGETVTEMQLFNALGGTPDAGGTWTPTLAGEGTYTYTHAATANCSASSAQVVVTEETPLDPGMNGTLTICEGQTVTEMQLFNALEGTPEPGGTWTPAFAGEGAYTYTHPATAACPETSATVIVTAVECSTVAVNDINQTPVNTPVSGDVSTNDYDPQGDNQTVTSALADTDGDGIIAENLPIGVSVSIFGTDDAGNIVTAGTIMLNANGTYTFTPVLGFSGDVNFEYTVTDDNPLATSTDDATVAIEVIPASDPMANEPPIANDDTKTTEEGTPVGGNVLDNDSDPDGDVITVTSALADTDGDGLVDEPLGLSNITSIFGEDNNGNIVLAGTIVLNSNGSFIFNPTPGYLGKVPVDYTISDPDGLMDSATLTILVVEEDGNATFANDDANVGLQDEPQTGNVLDNDTDPEGDDQIVSGATDFANNAITVNGLTSNSLPSGGTLIIDTDGSYTYTPATGFVGTEIVQYSIIDDGNPIATDVATLYLTTLPTNSTVALNDINQTPVNVQVNGNVLTNDFDPEGDNQTVSSALADTDGDGVVDENLPIGSLTSIFGTDDDGNIVLAGLLILNTNGSYTYTPANDFSGDVPFEYTVVDDNANPATDNATVTIEVIPASDPVNNEPPVANDDTKTTEQGVPVGGNVLDNDSDPDGDVITVTSALVDTDGDGLVDEPLSLSTPTPIYGIDNGGNIVLAGTLILNSNGTFIFNPEADFTGKIPAEYTISDPEGLMDSATLTILILEDDGNITFANDDANIGLQNEPQTGNVLDNDTDPEGDDQMVNGATDFANNALTVDGVTINTLPSGGTLVIDTDGTYTYTPATDYVGTEIVIYSIEDDGSPVATDVATLYLTTLPGGDNLVKISVKAFLQGALLGTNDGLMRDDLRLDEIIPSVEPYSGLSFLQLNGGGGETVATPMTVFDNKGNNSIVDWVLVELRDENDPATIVATRNGLIQRDGDVVDIDGTSALCFEQSTPASYYVAIRHRNHNGIMTANPIALDNAGVLVDFTDGNLDLFNTAAVHDNRERVLVDGQLALWAGNTNTDDKIVFAGQDNDKDPIFNEIDQAPGNIFSLQTYIYPGYFTGDVNMDGRSIFAGQENDVDPIFNNVDGYPANIFKLQTYVIPEQLAK